LYGAIQKAEDFVRAFILGFEIKVRWNILKTRVSCKAQGAYPSRGLPLKGPTPRIRSSSLMMTPAMLIVRAICVVKL
jgi:hypothetical protein